MKSATLLNLENTFESFAVELGFQEPAGLRKERRSFYDDNQHAADERLNKLVGQLVMEASSQRIRGATYAITGLVVLRAYTHARRGDFLEARMLLLDSATELNPSNEMFSQKLRDLSEALGN